MNQQKLPTKSLEWYRNEIDHLLNRSTGPLKDRLWMAKQYQRAIELILKEGTDE